MNKNLLIYGLREAAEGIQRNLAAVAATVLLIFISLSITGSLFLLKSSADDVIAYLNDQVHLKVFLESGMNADEAARVLKSNPYIASARIESREQTIARLSHLFQDKEHLFRAFQESDIPDAIMLELVHKEDIHYIAIELNRMQGISEVIYPQEFARTVLDWTRNANRYGAAVLAIFAAASFLTVTQAINLALYQRQKEIRVKLLLGAKESHVRGQFLAEGWLIGLIAAILASFTLYMLYFYVLSGLQRQFSAVFHISGAAINGAMLSMMLLGSFIGLLGSYISTRKLLKRA